MHVMSLALQLKRLLFLPSFLGDNTWLASVCQPSLAAWDASKSQHCGASRLFPWFPECQKLFSGSSKMGSITHRQLAVCKKKTKKTKKNLEDP